jgi:uncharacterized surface protein with fasciclin (FAS1) repeats
MKGTLSLFTILTVGAMSLPLVPAVGREPVAERQLRENGADLPKLPGRVLTETALSQELAKSKDLRTMSAIVKAAGLEVALSAKGPYTLLAPSDEAFAKVPEEQLAALLQDPARLKAFVMNHVLYGSISSKDLARVDMVLGVSGASHSVSGSGEALRVGEAKIVRRDVGAANGTMQVIDQVLTPVA